MGANRVKIELPAAEPRGQTSRGARRPAPALPKYGLAPAVSGKFCGDSVQFLLFPNASTVTGSRRRQFGCSSIVPGTLT